MYAVSKLPALTAFKPAKNVSHLAVNEPLSRNKLARVKEGGVLVATSLIGVRS